MVSTVLSVRRLNSREIVRERHLAGGSLSGMKRVNRRRERRRMRRVTESVHDSWVDTVAEIDLLWTTRDRDLDEEALPTFPDGCFLWNRDLSRVTGRFVAV